MPCSNVNLLPHPLDTNKDQLNTLPQSLFLTKGKSSGVKRARKARFPLIGRLPLKKSYSVHAAVANSRRSAPMRRSFRILSYKETIRDIAGRINDAPTAGKSTQQLFLRMSKAFHSEVN